MTAFGDNAILFINKIKKAAFFEKAAPKTLLAGLHIILKLYILFTFLVRLCGFFST
jgi:hypothetical protein